MAYIGYLYRVAITHQVKMAYIGYYITHQDKIAYIGYLSPTKSKWLILGTYHPPRQNGLYWVLITLNDKMAYIE